MPCHDALNHPSTGQYDEAMGVGTLDDLDREAVEMRDGGRQLLSGIATIGKEAGERRICVPAAFDEFGRAIAILNVGRTHQSVEQITGRVGRYVTLAPFDLLARVIAARSARLGGLDRLAVDDARSRFCLAALRDPCAGH